MTNNFRIERGFIRVINARKSFDLTAPRFGVKSFDIASFAYWERRMDVNLDEVLRGVANFIAHRSVGTDHRHDRNHAVATEEVRNIADASHIGIAVFATEAQAFGEVLAHCITIQQFNATSSLAEMRF